jgi:hypothetical protein
MIILLGIGCTKSVLPEKHKEVFLFSSPVQNRVVDDGRSQLHDRDNVGFISRQFDPAVVFENAVLNPDTLFKRTGLTWKTTEPLQGVFDFTRLIPDPVNKVVYVLEELTLPADTAMLLQIGSDDGLTVWVNGDSMFTDLSQRALKYDQNALLCSLKEGKNRILYKIEQGAGGWALFRKWRPYDDWQSYFSKANATVFSDLLDSHWITSDSVLLRPDQRVWLLTRFSGRFDWIDHEGLQLRTAWSGPLSQLPEFLPFQKPAPPNHLAWLRWQVYRDSIPDKPLFQEWYPVVKREDALALAKTFLREDRKKCNSDQKAVLEGMEEVFRFDLEAGAAGRRYSSRYKSLLLADLLGWPPGAHGPAIKGYHSATDKSLQPYRVFLPPAVHQRTPVVLSMHGEYDKDGNFWNSFEGLSHRLLVQRNTLATRTGCILLMPHGRGVQNFTGSAVEEIPHLVTLWADSSQKPLIFMTWSKASLVLFDQLGQLETQPHALVLISPLFPDGEEKVHNTIVPLIKKHPNMRWIIYHGTADEDAPVRHTRTAVDMLTRWGANVSYTEVSFASHWNYPIDVEYEGVSTARWYLSAN